MSEDNWLRSLHERPETAVVLEAAREQRISCYLVGGCVRDAILGRTPSDFDVVVDCEPSTFAEAVAKRIEGRVLQHGDPWCSCVVTPNDRSALSRIDVSRIAQGDMVADLARRDFTVNSIAVFLSASEPRVLDVFGGLPALSERRLSAVSDNSLGADAVRVMRAFRLESELGFAMSADTVKQAAAAAAGLRSVPSERVGDELCKILALPKSFAAIHGLERIGALKEIIPELAPAIGMGQGRHHNRDVMGHSIACLQELELSSRRLLGYHDEVSQALDHQLGYSTTVLAALKLSCLIHDVGKPETRTLDGSEVHFYGHASAGAPRARAVAARLRLGGNVAEFVGNLTVNHMRPLELSRLSQVSDRAMTRYCLDLGHHVPPALLLAISDTLASRQRNQGDARVIKVSRILMDHYLKIRRRVARHPLPINGHDIMNHLALEPGPRVGAILDRVRETHLASGPLTRSDALRLAEEIRSRLAEDE